MYQYKTTSETDLPRRNIGKIATVMSTQAQHHLQTKTSERQQLLDKDTATAGTGTSSQTTTTFQTAAADKQDCRHDATVRRRRGVEQNPRNRRQTGRQDDRVQTATIGDKEVVKTVRNSERSSQK